MPLIGSQGIAMESVGDRPNSIRVTLFWTMHSLFTINCSEILTEATYQMAIRYHLYFHNSPVLFLQKDICKVRCIKADLRQRRFT